MKTRMVEERIGEDMGPVDWEHPIAKDMPEHWREAEKNPELFRYCSNGGFTSFQLIKVCMYDGWPYWTPRPALAYVGPLGGLEWAFFDSYGVSPSSIFRDTRRAAELPSGGRDD